MPGSEWAAGDALRREVLGDPYVDGVSDAWAGAAELQDLVVRFAWGTVWQRPAFDHRQRSLLTVAVLTAMNRRHELELHIGGALRNGCTVDELVEVALHCAVYCGVPAAIDTVRSIKRISEEQISPEQVSAEQVSAEQVSAEQARAEQISAEQAGEDGS